jgi:hypothetical protein
MPYHHRFQTLTTLLNQAVKFEANKSREQAGASLKLLSPHWRAYLPNSAQQWWWQCHFRGWHPGHRE